MPGPNIPGRVLVVDNDRDTLALYGRVFAAAGFEVSAAADGGEALQLARAMPPDVIVTDVILAGAMNGHDLIRAIRADATLRHIPILAVTGSTASIGGMAGTPVLIKPVSPRTLVARVKTAMANRPEA